MIHYSVGHCIEVYRQQPNSPRQLKAEHIKAVKLKHKSDLGGKGCYIYTRKAAKGEVPFYVGIATKSFFQEVFTEHKLGKIKDEILENKRGVVRLYLIELKTDTPLAQKSIEQVERYLIGVALEANPKLRNVKTERSRAWSIAGLIRPGQGKPSQKAKALKSALKI